MKQAFTPNGLNFFELQTVIIPSSRRRAVSAPVSSDCKLNSLPCSIAASHFSFNPHQLHYQTPLALPLLPQRSVGPRKSLCQVSLQHSHLARLQLHHLDRRYGTKKWRWLWKNCWEAAHTFNFRLYLLACGKQLLLNGSLTPKLDVEIVGWPSSCSSFKTSNHDFAHILCRITTGQMRSTYLLKVSMIWNMRNLEHAMQKRIDGCG